jgi:hypothetical protein
VKHRDAQAFADDIWHDILSTPALKETVEFYGLELVPTEAVVPHVGSKQLEWGVRLLTVDANRFPILVRSYADWDLLKAQLANQQPATALQPV